MHGFTKREINLLSDIVYVANTDILSPSSWSEIHSLLRKLIPTDIATTVLFDKHTNRPANYVCSDVEPDFFRPYQEYYHKKEPVIGRALPRGIYAWRPTDVVPRRVWESSELYHDYLAPNGCRHFLAMVLGSGSDNVRARIFFSRTQANRPFTRKDLQLMGLFRPHFANALRKADFVEELSRSRLLFHTGFDRASVSLFIFDDRARLAHMNRAGRDMCDSFGDMKNEVLRQLHEAVAELIARHYEPVGSCCSPRDTHLKLGDREFALATEFIPATDSPGYCILRAEDISDPVLRTANHLTKVHGLSVWEAHVAIMVVKGLSDQEIADRLFMTEASIQGHVAEILRKLRLKEREQISPRLLQS